MAASGDFNVKVFYTWGQAKGKVIDKDFGIEREWDIDLLSGYDHSFVQNTSSEPGSHHYKGIINPSLINEVKAFNPDKIIVYGWKFKSHLQLMRHFKGKTPLYFRGDSTLLDDAVGFSIKKSLRRLLLQWVYGHVDFALSPGTASDKYFLNAGLSANQIIRAPHAIDNERFSNPSDGNLSYLEESLRWRSELSISDHTCVFLYAGKLQCLKNPQLLIRAFLRLKSNYKDVFLVVVGNGELENELKERYSNEINFQKYIHFLPFQNQSMMPVVYRLGDIYVLPSNSETWGLAINEAMACGRPVIASDKCGAAAAMIKNNENGFVFKAGDENDLYNCMEKMVNADLSSMGARAQETVQHFSYASFASALQSLA